MQVSLAPLSVLLSLRLFSLLRCSLLVFLFHAVQRLAFCRGFSTLLLFQSGCFIYGPAVDILAFVSPVFQ